MWCTNCQADVAGEVSADAKSLLCTTCGSEVSSIRAPGKLPSTRGARDLLERWNTEELLDPYQPARRVDSDSGEEQESKEHADARLPADIEQANGGSPDPVRKAPTKQSKEPSTDEGDSRESRIARRPSQRKYRVDRGGPIAEAAAPHEPRDVHAAHGSRVDQSHASAPVPHFSIDSAFENRRQPGRGESFWGQLLAYAGVGVLTVGTGLVVWGYFGGQESYTPTGWLLATAGQMLLFLGVVTLISGGMEQTTHEVTQRIERLGDHIIRIERHTSEQTLRGPHFADATPPVESEMSSATGPANG